LNANDLIFTETGIRLRDQDSSYRRQVTVSRAKCKHHFFYLSFSRTVPRHRYTEYAFTVKCS